MTPAQIRLVKQSFAAIAPQRERVAASFFRHLFEIDPTLRFLFRGDLRAQGLRLVHGLGLIVGSLDRLHAYVPALEALALRHVGYGLEEVHYAKVGEALMRTLSASLGGAFSPEVENAWIAGHALISDLMIAAARQDYRLAA